MPRCLRDNRCNSTTRGRQPGRRDDGCRALAGSASARPYLRWALRLRGYQHRRLRRPSCPSRRPRPERVRFFETTRAAESAGYRACRRCHPTSAVTAPTAAAAIQRDPRYLSEHSDEAISLAKLGADDAVERVASPTGIQAGAWRLAAGVSGSLSCRSVSQTSAIRPGCHRRDVRGRIWIAKPYLRVVAHR